jgi:hypothetical protein
MKTDIRKTIAREEFDYPALMSALSAYANPRDKVTTLLRNGSIIRVKKGIYVFGNEYRRRPFCRELLANLIYGPSYVSLDYALSYHGLIPERVQTVTSITPKRGKRFATPVGLFVYRQTPMAFFSLGMDRVEQGEVSFLLATPERALADKLRDDRGGPLRTRREMTVYLFENLRIDRTLFLAMDRELLWELSDRLGSGKVAACARLFDTMRKGA